MTSYARLLFGLLSAASAPAAAWSLPAITLADRGELIIQQDASVTYQPWQLDALPPPGRIGLLMLMPARASSRKVLAPLEQALIKAAYDYRQVVSVSIINLDDATWGAGLFVQAQLEKEKTAEPDVHLIVDESGQARRALELAKGLVHVLLYDCHGQVLLQHQGAFSEPQVKAILQQLDQALLKPTCTLNTETAQP